MIDKSEESVSKIWDGVKSRANTKIREGQSINDIRTSTHIYKQTNIPDF